MFEDQLGSLDYSNSTLDTGFTDSKRSGVSGFRALLLSLGITATGCVTPEALKPRDYPNGVRYPELSETEVNIPSTFPNLSDPTLAPAKSFRIFVCDGAFFQHEPYSASSWVGDLAREVMRDRPDMSIDVTCITYSERVDIASSAEKFAKLVCHELEKKPLQESEQIILVGHSQGAFIQTYLLKRHEADASFCPKFPWERIHESISIDLPLGDIEAYRGPFHGLLSPLRTLVKADPILFPTIVSIIYPAGLDYVKETDSLKLVSEPAKCEKRFIRTNSKGEPVFIGISGKDIDNPDSQWSHHPFVEGHVDVPKNIEFREKLRNSVCSALGVDNLDPTTAAKPVASIPFHPFWWR